METEDNSPNGLNMKSNNNNNHGHGGQVGGGKGNTEIRHYWLFNCKLKFYEEKLKCADCLPGYMKFRNIDGQSAKSIRDALMKTVQILL